MEVKIIIDFSKKNKNLLIDLSYGSFGEESEFPKLMGKRENAKTFEIKRHMHTSLRLPTTLPCE